MDPVTVLVQGAGGGGGNNLIRSLRQSGLPLRILGSNCLPHAVAKSTADATALLPVSTDPGYVDALKAHIAAERIDLVMPNSDREVAAVSELRDALPCRVFLPPDEAIRVAQDKHETYRRLTRAGIPMATSIAVADHDSIEDAIAALPPGERFWVRPRRGSGSKGATWVRTPAQAEAWISLWEDLRGSARDDFQVCAFLPGRDYAFQSVWYRGRLVVASLVERLAYYGGAGRLSGMSSTPEIARTTRDVETFEMLCGAVRALADEPHGNFSMDLKGDADGVMNVTEVNIGRFCMITTVFDSTDRHNTAGTHVRCAFDDPPSAADIGDPFDVEDGWLLIRELDTEPLVVHESTLPAPLEVS